MRRAVVFFCLLLCMCGGAMTKNAPPSSPEAAPSSPEAPSDAAGAPAQPSASGMQFAPGAAPPSAPPPAVQSTAAGAPAIREAQRVAARAELDRAQSDLQASANDCASACRALASMDRATTHLCALADQPEDQRRCDDAKQRLTAAREHVRQTCGSCAP